MIWRWTIIDCLIIKSYLQNLTEATNFTDNTRNVLFLSLLLKKRLLLTHSDTGNKRSHWKTLARDAKYFLSPRASHLSSGRIHYCNGSKWVSVCCWTPYRSTTVFVEDKRDIGSLIWLSHDRCILIFLGESGDGYWYVLIIIHLVRILHKNSRVFAHLTYFVLSRASKGFFF